MSKCKHDGQVTDDNCCFKCGVNIDHARIAELEDELYVANKTALKYIRLYTELQESGGGVNND